MIGVGLVGYGYWGPNLARCFAETEGCRLVAIADPAPDALARAGKRSPFGRAVPGLASSSRRSAASTRW